jgi:hypothetical protein
MPYTEKTPDRTSELVRVRKFNPAPHKLDRAPWFFVQASGCPSSPPAPVCTGRRFRLQLGQSKIPNPFTFPGVCNAPLLSSVWLVHAAHFPLPPGRSRTSDPVPTSRSLQQVQRTAFCLGRSVPEGAARTAQSPQPVTLVRALPRPGPWMGREGGPSASFRERDAFGRLRDPAGFWQEAQPMG